MRSLAFLLMLTAAFADPTAEVARALARHEEALKKRPSDAAAAEKVVSACMQSARLTGDPSYYKRAMAVVDGMKKLDPEGARPEALGAWVLTGEHRFADAVTRARAALARKPGDAMASGVLSDALLELGRYDEAEAALQTMLDARPGADAYSRAAYLRAVRGDLDGAEEVLGLAAGAVDPARDPEMAAWLSTQAGDLQCWRGDAAKARLAYTAALARVPGYASAAAGLARVAARAGKLDEAAALLAECLKKRPSADVAASLEDVERARGREPDARQAAGAVDVLHALALASGAPADRALARADADHGRQLERALAYAQQELAARPDIQSEDVLGWVLHKMGRHADALAHTERAVRLKTPDPMLEAHHGLVLAALGRAADAKPWISGALKRGVALDLCLVKELETWLVRQR